MSSSLRSRSRARRLGGRTTDGVVTRSSPLSARQDRTAQTHATVPAHQPKPGSRLHGRRIVGERSVILRAPASARKHGRARYARSRRARSDGRHRGVPNPDPHLALGVAGLEQLRTDSRVGGGHAARIAAQNKLAVYLWERSPAGPRRASARRLASARCAPVLGPSRCEKAYANGKRRSGSGRRSSQNRWFWPITDQPAHSAPFFEGALSRGTVT